MHAPKSHSIDLLDVGAEGVESCVDGGPLVNYSPWWDYPTMQKRLFFVKYQSVDATYRTPTQLG